MFFHVSVKINRKGEVGDQPGDREAKGHHVDCAVEGDDEKPPCAAQDTNTEKSDDGGKHRVSHSAERRKHDLNRNI